MKGILEEIENKIYHDLAEGKKFNTIVLSPAKFHKLKKELKEYLIVKDYRNFSYILLFGGYKVYNDIYCPKNDILTTLFYDKI
jgi:hypothetical protein